MYEARSAEYIRIYESIEFRSFFDLNTQNMHMRSKILYRKTQFHCEHGKTGIFVKCPTWPVLQITVDA